MGATQMRKEICNYVHHADGRFIHLVYGMINEDKKGNVFYTVQGKPLSQQQYKEEIDEARKQYKNGDYISHEGLKKKTRTW